MFCVCLGVRTRGGPTGRHTVATKSGSQFPLGVRNFWSHPTCKKQRSHMQRLPTTWSKRAMAHAARKPLY